MVEEVKGEERRDKGRERERTRKKSSKDERENQMQFLLFLTPKEAPRQQQQQ